MMTQVLEPGGTAAAHDEPQIWEPAPENQNCTDAVPYSNDEQAKPETNIAPTPQLG